MGYGINQEHLDRGLLGLKFEAEVVNRREDIRSGERELWAGLIVGHAES